MSDEKRNAAQVLSDASLEYDAGAISHEELLAEVVPIVMELDARMAALERLTPTRQPPPKAEFWADMDGL